jgi:hypothetical protein
MELRRPALDCLQLRNQRSALQFREFTARFQIGLNEPSCPTRDSAIGAISKGDKTIEISRTAFMASGDFTKGCHIPAIEGQQFASQIGGRCFQIGALCCQRVKLPAT